MAKSLIDIKQDLSAASQISKRSFTIRQKSLFKSIGDLLDNLISSMSSIFNKTFNKEFQ